MSTINTCYNDENGSKNLTKRKITKDENSKHAPSQSQAVKNAFRQKDKCNKIEKEQHFFKTKSFNDFMLS